MSCPIRRRPRHPSLRRIGDWPEPMPELVRWLRERVRDLRVRDPTSRNRFRHPSRLRIDLHFAVRLRKLGVDLLRHRQQQSPIRYAVIYDGTFKKNCPV